MPHTLVRDKYCAGERATTPDLSSIYRQNIDYVWRTLIHLGIRDADVEDVAHEVFIVVQRKIADFEGRSSLRTWIYGICLKTAADYRARAFRRRERSTEVTPEYNDYTSQPPAETRVLFRQLLRLLEQLTDEQREVFVLYEIEEQDMKDVALSAGCPLQTAYSRLHAARDRLRQVLATEACAP